MTDLILSEDFDLEIKDGDFVSSEAKDQDVLLTLDSELGFWRQYPYLTASLLSIMNASIDSVRKSVTKAMTLNGFTIKKIRYNTSTKKIEISV